MHTELALRLGLVHPDMTFVFQLINTIILYLILKHFLFKPVTEFMAKREKEIKDQISEAQKVEDEALALKSQYEEKLQAADEEGKEIIKDHTARAENRAFEIVKTAESEVDKMKVNAHRELERERVKAVNELKDQISELTVMAASKVVEKDLDEAAHKELVDKFISEVGDAQWQN